LKSAEPDKESTLSLIRNDFTIKIKKKKTGFNNYIDLTLKIPIMMILGKSRLQAMSTQMESIGIRVPFYFRSKKSLDKKNLDISIISFVIKIITNELISI
jgi:hypothetical protein